ncbi:MAG: hypothetical protein GX213_04720 [Clostridiaceae bacterium]|nr:hypothetical protein [Clostridiaceae bacterium]
MDKRRFFHFAKSTDGTTTFHVSNIKSECYNLELERANPDIIDVQNNMIAYTPISNYQDEIKILTFNAEDKSTKVIAEAKIDGVLRLPSAGFSPNSKNFAFLYAPQETPIIQRVNILDINSNMLSTIKEKNFNDKKLLKVFQVLNEKMIQSY